MSVDTKSVPNHLYVPRRRGRVDPIVAEALKGYEIAKLKKWAKDNNVRLPDAANTIPVEEEPEIYKEELIKRLKSDAGELHAVTRRLRRTTTSNTENLLQANSTVYSVSLFEAVKEWKESTKTPTPVIQVESPPQSEEVIALVSRLNALIDQLQPLIEIWLDKITGNQGLEGRQDDEEVMS